ncbi:MAG: glutamate--tRNA ligase [Flavobacteriales bacterium]
MSKEVRVRFAPSPTGPLHMGGVRTALYNYLFAKKHNGKFVLRIEDTDRSRYIDKAEDYIQDSMEWCGLIPSEGPRKGGEYAPYRQSDRKHMYKQYVDKLIQDGNAYYAFDTAEELEDMREKARAQNVQAPQYNAITRNYMKNSISLSKDEVQKRFDEGRPFVVRLKMPRNEEIKFKDRIRDWVVVHTSNLDDKVIFKSDGMPTYHMANVVDDHTMGITHVIRGEEWLPSAPLHVKLYEFLGWEKPEFAHLPLILRPDGKGKLSKRDGDRLGVPVFPLEWEDQESKEVFPGYKETGYYPGAFLNILAMLGWNPGTEQEVFSLQELIDQFSLDRVGKAGAKFDVNKAKWYNEQFLKSKDDAELAEHVKNHPKIKDKNIDKEYLENVCRLMKERATFPGDMINEGMYFFEKPEEYDEKTLKKKWKEETPKILKELKSVLENIEVFNSENIEKEFKGFLNEKGLGFGKVMPNFRLVLTGKGMGPSIFEITALLGKDEVSERIEAGLKNLDHKGKSDN